MRSGVDECARRFAVCRLRERLRVRTRVWWYFEYATPGYVVCHELVYDI